MTNLTYSQFRYLQLKAGEGRGNIIDAQVMAECEDSGWIEADGVSP